MRLTFQGFQGKRMYVTHALNQKLSTIGQLFDSSIGRLPAESATALAGAGATQPTILECRCFSLFACLGTRRSALCMGLLRDRCGFC